MKKIIFVLTALASLELAHATIHLSYEKETGGPSGTGRSEVLCSPDGCSSTSSCSDGYGSCLNEAGFSNSCPTYKSVSTACPGASRVWIENEVENEVQEVWNKTDNNIETGTYIKTYINISTNETAMVTYSWQPRSLGSSIFDITISTVIIPSSTE